MACEGAFVLPDNVLTQLGLDTEVQREESKIRPNMVTVEITLSQHVSHASGATLTPLDLPALMQYGRARQIWSLERQDQGGIQCAVTVLDAWHQALRLRCMWHAMHTGQAYSDVDGCSPATPNAQRETDHV